jgi:hypothetical protein
LEWWGSISYMNTIMIHLMGMGIYIHWLMTHYSVHVLRWERK